MKKLLLLTSMMISTLVYANNSGVNFFYYGNLPDAKEISNKITVLDVRSVFYNNNEQIKKRLIRQLIPINNRVLVNSESKNPDQDNFVLNLVITQYPNINIIYNNKYMK